MSDPFDSLRDTEPSVDPDPDFADSLISRVQERFDRSASMPSTDGTEDLTDLEVVPMSAPRPRRLWWLTAAAVVLLIAGGVWLVAANRGDSSQPSTDQSTTTSAPEGSTAGAVPDALVGRWMTSTRAQWSESAGMSLRLTDAKYQMSLSNENGVTRISGDASSPSDGTLTFDGEAQCQDATGTYSYSLSDSGRTMELTEVDDPCELRSTSVVGTYWLMGCKDPNDNCLGLLDAGTYASQFARPLADPTAEWAPAFGGITYTVPEGWANWDDWPFEFGLTTADAFATTTADASVPDQELTVLPQAGALVAAGRCDDVRDTSATVDDTIAALQATPGLVVGTPQPITVGGIDGVSVELSVDGSAIVPCNGDRVVPILSTRPTEGGFGLAETSKAVLVLLPRPDGNGFFAVIAHSTDATTFDAFWTEAQSVLESFQFS